MLAGLFSRSARKVVFHRHRLSAAVRAMLCAKMNVIVVSGSNTAVKTIYLSVNYLQDIFSTD
jgi:vancomycin permeability regulator SanA